MKKKRLTSDAVCDGVNAFELEEVPDDKPIERGMKLLANEEFELETGGYESEPEEDEPDKLEDTLHLDDGPDKKSVSKKRKALKKLKSPKYVSILFQYIKLNHVLAVYLIFLSSCDGQ